MLTIAEKLKVIITAPAPIKEKCIGVVHIFININIVYSSATRASWRPKVLQVHPLIAQLKHVHTNKHSWLCEIGQVTFIPASLIMGKSAEYLGNWCDPNQAVGHGLYHHMVGQNGTLMCWNLVA